MSVVAVGFSLLPEDLPPASCESGIVFVEMEWFFLRRKGFSLVDCHRIAGAEPVGIGGAVFLRH